MNSALLIQLAGSGVAVAVMVAVAAWAKIARATPPLDEERARGLLAEEFPGREPEHVWLGEDGQGAVAKCGTTALVLCRLGDGYVARQVPWADALAATFRDGRLSIVLREAGAPRAVIALAAWPPRSAAAL